MNYFPLTQGTRLEIEDEFQNVQDASRWERVVSSRVGCEYTPSIDGNVRRPIKLGTEEGFRDFLKWLQEYDKGLHIELSTGGSYETVDADEAITKAQLFVSKRLPEFKIRYSYMDGANGLLVLQTKEFRWLDKQ